ncbi:sugar ABC transporter substrate-binding protein [Mahella sp.]|uniref:ABC transporter substrate-binding protein n=1 Tax=Mahella sp. TaxID=2798721 RepID=UPI0025BBCEC2|nr:sugar ABC transporter substrate-binding protein [Mahella sp.]MBZ4666182.1 extracellular solute-binding protein family 1 [Mahella sp.]
MNRIKYIIITIAVFVMLAVSAAAYINTNTKSIVLEFGMFAGSNWDVANANSYVIIDKAIERFEKKHKNVKIHYYSGILKDDYSEWFSKQVLLGKTPDVFMILSNDFNQFASLGVLKNLDELINNDKTFNKDKYFQTTLLAGEYHGIQYALPYEAVPTLMFVNKTLLEKEGIDVPSSGWTWGDLYEICKKVTKDINGDGILEQFGIYNYEWLDAVRTNGAVLFDENEMKIDLSDEKVVEAVKFIKMLYDLNQEQNVMKEDFDSGNVVFMPLSFADYRTYKTYPYKIMKYLNFQWDCITFPAGKDGGNISGVNTLLMGISSKTAHEELAWEFLKLLTYDEEIQMDIFRYSQGASVLKNVAGSQKAELILQEDMEESEKVIDNVLLSRVIEEGTVAPKILKYNEAITIANNGIQEIIRYDKNVESSLKILERKINQYLKQ